MKTYPTFNFILFSALLLSISGVLGPKLILECGCENVAGKLRLDEQLNDISLTRLAPRPLFRDGDGRVVPLDALDFKGVPVDVVLKLHPLLALVSPVLKGERQTCCVSQSENSITQLTFPTERGCSSWLTMTRLVPSGGKGVL